ncbi:glycosyltransferase [Pseudonocardia sp. KRD-184]|uniref:Glycosyltransferase n=1 Tax=Pseudonocardia oceani TaxID=2792013 RepID=A0ABS6U5H8_9PSEU|nr:glycosyltransferase [Pseudonocardia oceani]MBW0096510.1 glycosyltransferase [Pseudonocardia oceani]MBW0122749.1 glycosyltransferase [Pseudonocardia oceani]MBW0127476.1 glycosyltransferase [Pseudonocardia oceani]
MIAESSSVAGGGHILHVAQPTDAGVHRYVLAAATHQQEQGWGVSVACPEAGSLSGDVRRAGVAWHRWEASRDPGRSVPAEIRELADLVHRVKPDVVHLHSSKAGLVGRLALRGRVPTLFQPHGWSWLAASGGQARAARMWERRAARWADTIVCVGDGEAELGRRAGVRNLVVVRSGVDLTWFKPATTAEASAAAASLNLNREDPVVLCPGRITRQKGQDVLLQAWEGVRRTCPTAQLVLLGDGDLPVQGLPDRVRRDQAVADVRLHYAAADVVVLPSRWEGLALTAIEALASGCSLVGTDVPGLSELVRTGHGQVVPSDDPTALAAALSRRVLDLSSTRMEGERAAVVAQGFDVRRTHAALLDLTVGVMRSHRRPVAI